jgi:hypothetical protein
LVAKQRACSAIFVGNCLSATTLPGIIAESSKMSTATVVAGKAALSEHEHYASVFSS